MTVLKVRENFSSQIPSCWYSAPANLNHPPIPQIVPPVNQRLTNFMDKWALKQCPHCHKVWQRDVNACRYLILFFLIFRNIGNIFYSLQQNGVRPAIYGPPANGEVDLLNLAV